MGQEGGAKLCRGAMNKQGEIGKGGKGGYKGKVKQRENSLGWIK